MRALVVYHSKSGNTKKAAEDISEELERFVHVDMEAIVVNRYNPFLLGTLRAFKDMFSDERFPLVGLTYDPLKYEFIIIGTPVWGNSCTPPIDSYLSELQDFSYRVGFFTTQSGQPTFDAVKEMEKTSGMEADVKLAIRKGDIGNAEYFNDIKIFVSDLLGIDHHID